MYLLVSGRIYLGYTSVCGGWTWPRMGRAARCPPGGGSLSARPSSGTTLAPFNAR